MAPGCTIELSANRCGNVCPGEGQCIYAQNDNHSTLEGYVNEYISKPGRLRIIRNELTNGGWVDLRLCKLKAEWLKLINKVLLH